MTFSIRIVILGAGVLAAPAAAQTETFQYDALGRLTDWNVSGGPASGTNLSTGYDAADNRTSNTITGAPLAAATPATNTAALPDPPPPKQVPERKIVMTPIPSRVRQ